MVDAVRRHFSVRTRLTLWYAASLALTMIVLAAAAHVVMRNTIEAQFEEDLKHSASMLAKRLDHEMTEGDPATEASASTVRKSQFRNLALQVYGEDLAILAGSADLGDRALADLPVVSTAPPFDAEPSITLIDDPSLDPSGVLLAAIAVREPSTGRRIVLVAAEGRTPVIRALSAQRNVFLLLAPLLLGLSVAGGWALARRALAPVAVMAAQARRMGADRLSDRLAVANPDDELGALAATFNELLDRIAASVAQMRTFVADASHELRTPVAVIRSGANVALTPPVDLDESVETLQVIQEQSAQLTKLVDDMFLLARADAGDPGVLRSDTVGIDALVGSCIRAAEPLARERGVTIRLCTDASHATCVGDRARLEQMLMNLLTNAANYSGVGGSVDVSIVVRESAKGTVARIAISDAGPGIPKTERDAVFGRFVRLDKARSRETGGSGLGLPIARWVAEAHGGALVLEETPGGGCTFAATLPVAIVHDAENVEATVLHQDSSHSTI